MRNPGVTTAALPHGGADLQCVPMVKISYF